MYFAWKNIDADYYGLFHYRRILDFTPRDIINRLLSFLTPQRFLQTKYHLKATQISHILQTKSPDIIIPKRQQLTSHLNLYSTYQYAHYDRDFKKAISFIKTHYPNMTNALNQAIFTNNQAVCYGNMFVMKKELFFDYCKWLFSVLFGIMNEIPYKTYDSYQGRVFGFLSERLFNVWLIHKIQTDNIKILEYKTKLLYAKNKKFFGVVYSNGYKRYYAFFIRIYKKQVDIINNDSSTQTNDCTSNNKDIK